MYVNTLPTEASFDLSSTSSLGISRLAVFDATFGSTTAFGIMHPSRCLLQHATRIVLYTRAQCALCDEAKIVLKRVWEKRPFEFQEVDVMARENRQWRKPYQFETPVVRMTLWTVPGKQRS